MIELLDHMEAVCHNLSVCQLLAHGLAVGVPHVHRHLPNGLPLFFGQTVQPFFQRVFLAIGQDRDDTPALQVR